MTPRPSHHSHLFRLCLEVVLEVVEIVPKVGGGLKVVEVVPKMLGGYAKGGGGCAEGDGGCVEGAWKLC